MLPREELTEIFGALERVSDRAINYLGDLEKQIKLLKEVNNDVLGFKEYLKSIILEDRVSGPFLLAGAESILATLKDGLAKTILVDRLNDAIQSSEEFSREPFKGRLLAAARADNILKLKPRFRGNSASYTVDVEFNFDKVAGTLEQWAQAVTAVRDAHGWPKTTASSLFWKERIFLRSGGTFKKDSSKKLAGADFWRQTIDERLSVSGAIAPFWSLLEDGNQGSVKMSSNEPGGMAYPVSGPTHFLDAAKTGIKSTFTILFRPVVSDLDSFLRYVNDIDQQVNELVEKINDTIIKVEESLIPEEVVVDVARKYGFDEVYKTNSRLKRLIYERTVVGEYTNVRITKDGRVEITVPGQRRKRISIKKFEALVAGIE